jgi:ribosomal protein S18 acetylase RimI-like enzyme
MVDLKPLTSRQDKRLYLKYVNKFRKDYFTDADPQDMQDVNYALENNILCLLILLNNKVIGMLEATPGNVYATKVLNIATIYIDKKYRKQGIAKQVYKFMESYIDIALHIEQSNFAKNIDKFINCGFNFYNDMKNTDNVDHRQYDEKTYVLYTKQHIDAFKPILVKEIA